MEMRQLRYFLAVADAGHITRAAATLGLKQPPLSQQIRALETQIGLTLFNRHPKGVTLTEAGQLLQGEARRLLHEMELLEARLNRVAQGQQGRLALGFTSSAASHAYMPRTLNECRRLHPQLSLELTECNAAELTEAVLSEKLDCGFLRVPVARPPGLAFETLFDESVLLALPKDHPLARAGHGAGSGSKALSLSAVREEGFILTRRPGASGLYANLIALCKAKGFVPRIVAEVPRMLTNLNLVAAGAGVSVVPASMRGVHAHAVIYRSIEETHALRAPMTLVWRQMDLAGPTATFVALARRMVQRSNAESNSNR